MKEFDTGRLRIAETYIRRMADGKHPVTNQSVKNDILNDPNVIRCMHFISEVLEQVRANNGLVGKKYVRPKQKFPFEVLKEFSYRRDKPISHVLKQMAEPLEGENIRKLNPATVNKWLAANGYIEKRTIEESGRESWIPLQKGLDLGMYTEIRGEEGYQYAVIMYSRAAQEFLAEHLKEIFEEAENVKSDRIKSE